MLKMRDVTWRVGHRCVLDRVDLDVERGTPCVLLGSNGAGKTTLLQIAAGVIEAQRGSTTIDGFAVTDRRARARIGYAPAAATMPEYLAVHEWLDLLAALRGVGRREVDESVAVWGVERVLGTRLGALSLGERRRVVLATAELGAPPLLLLDEPSVGLDPDARVLLTERLRAHSTTGGAVLLATHDPSLASGLHCHFRILHAGCIAPAADGPVSASGS